MKVALLGYSGSGKTEIVAALSGRKYESFDPKKPVVISVKIHDRRLLAIAEKVKPEKTTEPEIAFIDIKGPPEGMGFDEKIIEHALFSDTIALVIPATSQGRNPVNELDSLCLELLYRDTDRIKGILEKRHQEISHGKRKKSQEEDFLEKCFSHLEKETFLLSMEMRHQEKVFLTSLGLITSKKFLVLANGNTMLTELQSRATHYNFGFCQIDAARTDKESIEMFWKQFLIAAGLIRFYTIVGKETRAWLLPEGSTVLDAAAAIHTDIAKGFVRADVVRYEDFISLGSFAACREKGLLRSEAKTGIVKDGDIVHIHSTR
ncbi:MAG TPA: DUF933 domain-containing protein [bacterium]|nr:DUF933 domain-containing protein [bacterium]HOL35596.1 DUF933 domain-containing protein [bacterium]HPP08971.1 DUF933 domain-containing protein [bacterium]